MILKHKILQAVQEGISSSFKFSSNSNIDNSSYIDFSDSKINNVHSLCIEDIECIDLGLPSGLRWCSHNVGATCGDTPESWIGDYYAWGEIIPNKLYYGSNNYKWTEPNSTAMFKYVVDNESGEVDNLITLLPEDDAVTQNYSKACRMPTEEDVKELFKHTTYEWATNYQGVKGLNGKLMISKINGNSIFFPTTGMFHDELRNTHRGFNWTSSLNQTESSTTAIHMSIDSWDGYNGRVIGNFYRYCGCPVRPVYPTK